MYKIFKGFFKYGPKPKSNRCSNNMHETKSSQNFMAIYDKLYDERDDYVEIKGFSFSFSFSFADYNIQLIGYVCYLNLLTFEYLNIIKS